MIEKLHSQQQSIQRNFAISWIVLTIIALFLALIYQAQLLNAQRRNTLQLQANEIAFKFDDLIQDLLHPIYSLPSFTNSECPTLLPKLRHTIFNYPHLSGILITNQQNEILCSTLTTAISLPPSTQANVSLQGPIDLQQSIDDVFLLKQRFGDYYYGVLVLKKILTEKTIFDNADFINIKLFDKHTNKLLFSLKEQESDVAEYIRIPLQNIENLQLLFISDNSNFDWALVYREILTLLGILLLSGAFYIYFNRFLINRYSLNSALVYALQHRRFQPVYQPVWNEQTKTYYGAEVLIRWRAKGNEVIMPDFFIEEAEKSGLIIPITLQLAEKALQEFAPILQSKPSMHLAFNVSAAHFTSENFFERFNEIRQKYGVSAHQLMLEITERDLFNGADPTVLKHVELLKQQGFQLAIDDFGTGHASINYLHHFPFQYLKIDKLFIQAIGTGAITETLNEAIINLATSLQLTIIAEGVETKQQYEYLVERGIYLLQGWYFSQALTIEAINLLITQQEIPQ